MFKIAWAKTYNHPLPQGHRFPMEKYDLLPEQLLYEGTIRPENLFTPDILPEEKLLKIHDSHYWQQLSNLELSPKQQRVSGFPHSKALIERELQIMQGTLQAAEFALQHGAACNIAGGTHHAFNNKAEGFCLLNDIAIAAQHLLDEGKAKRILVVDLDVHQGNGTAKIFENEKRVFTFSMHGKDNYPLHKEQSDLDIPLEHQTNDKEYLKLLSSNLPRLIEHHEPDFIFYQSGVDVLASDKLGKLALSKEGCKQRDKLVLDLCHKNNIPICASMGGGYSERISEIVDAHANVYRLIAERWF
jgi:acetoin utilization deacetylase AcuC-like enzyme